jgi:hypothetical protein
VVQKAILGPKAQSTPESNKKKWSQAKKRFSAAACIGQIRRHHL